MDQYTRDRGETDALTPPPLATAIAGAGALEQVRTRDPAAGTGRDTKPVYLASGTVQYYEDEHGRVIWAKARGRSRSKIPQVVIIPDGDCLPNEAGPGPANEAPVPDPGNGEACEVHPVEDLHALEDPYGPDLEADPDEPADPDADPYESTRPDPGAPAERLCGPQRYKPARERERTIMRRMRDAARRAAARCALFMAAHYTLFERAARLAGFTIETLTVSAGIDPHVLGEEFRRLNEATMRKFPTQDAKAWAALWRRETHVNSTIHYHNAHVALGHDLEAILAFRRAWWLRRMARYGVHPDHAHDTGLRQLQGGVIPYLAKVDYEGITAAVAERSTLQPWQKVPKSKSWGVVNRAVFAEFHRAPKELELEPAVAAGRCIRIHEAQRRGRPLAPAFFDTDSGEPLAMVRGTHVGYASEYLVSGEPEDLKCTWAAAVTRWERSDPARALRELVELASEGPTNLGLGHTTTAEESSLKSWYAQDGRRVPEVPAPYRPPDSHLWH